MRSVYEYEYTDIGPGKRGGRHVVRSGGRYGTMHFIGHYMGGGVMKLYPADASAHKYAGIIVIRCDMLHIWRPAEKQPAQTDEEREAARALRRARKEAARRADAEQIKMEV